MLVLSVVFVLVTLLVVVAAQYARRRWDGTTSALCDQLDAARVPVYPQAFDARELEALPAPVQRYFRVALQPGQRMVAAVSVEHVGTFNTGEGTDSWKPFTSTQRVVTRRAGFVWDARIRFAPGITVFVHDAYVGGVGILHPSLFGLVSLASLRGTREVAEGELMRFFAEMAWYPTALLPSQGVSWQAVDDRSARATIADGELSLTLLFRFDDEGLITSVRADARGRTVGGKVVPTPWEGRWSHYEVRDGMRVPMAGEVAWVLPPGPKPYWRGRITRIAYEFAR